MIEIDISSLIPDVAYTMTPALADILVGDIADAARAKWLALAQQELNTSGQEYAANISEVKRAAGIAWIELSGKFPNMIEGGFSGFDMRDSMLRPGAPGVKESAEGNLYRSVFFRRGTTKSSGRNFPRITDLYAAELGADHGARLGKAALRAARKLMPYGSQGPLKPGQRRSLAAGQMSRGNKAKGIAAIAARPLKAGELSPAGRTVRSGHKTDLFAGTYRFTQQTSGGKTQSYYGAFRMISEKVPDGWMHPGYKPGEGADLAGKVQKYIDVVAPSMIGAAFGAEGT